MFLRLNHVCPNRNIVIYLTPASPTQPIAIPVASPAKSQARPKDICA